MWASVTDLPGRIPSASRYQPTLAAGLGGRQERLATSHQRSNTSVLAMTFAHLDATTVLSRRIYKLGIYSAVDPLESMSRMLSPLIIGEDHYAVARSGQYCSCCTVSPHIMHGCVAPAELSALKRSKLSRSC